MVGSQIVLVNRTDAVLKFVADSIHYELQPGPNYGFVEPHGYFAMAQNPVMGSEDYYTREFRSKVGILGGPLATDCSPLSDEELLVGMESIERFNRKTAGLAPVDIVTPRHRMPVGRLEGGPGDAAFAAGGN